MVRALSLALVPLFRCSAVCKMGLLQPTGLEDVCAYRLQSASQQQRGRLGSDCCRAAPALRQQSGIGTSGFPGNGGRELIKDQFLIFCFGGNAEQQQKCWSC